MIKVLVLMLANSVHNSQKPLGMLESYKNVQLT